jgi:hypothetical protein
MNSTLKNINAPSEKIKAVLKKIKVKNIEQLIRGGTTRRNRSKHTKKHYKHYKQVHRRTKHNKPFYFFN